MFGLILTNARAALSWVSYLPLHISRIPLEAPACWVALSSEAKVAMNMIRNQKDNFHLKRDVWSIISWHCWNQVEIQPEDRTVMYKSSQNSTVYSHALQLQWAKIPRMYHQEIHWLPTWRFTCAMGSDVSTSSTEWEFPGQWEAASTCNIPQGNSSIKPKAFCS